MYFIVVSSLHLIERADNLHLEACWFCDGLRKTAGNIVQLDENFNTVDKSILNSDLKLEGAIYHVPSLSMKTGACTVWFKKAARCFSQKWKNAGAGGFAVCVCLCV